MARGVPADAVCFDVPLIDVATGEVVGSGTDCLFEIEAQEDGGVKLFRADDLQSAGRVVHSGGADLRAGDHDG